MAAIVALVGLVTFVLIGIDRTGVYPLTTVQMLIPTAFAIFTYMVVITMWTLVRAFSERKHDSGSGEKSDDEKLRK